MDASDVKSTNKFLPYGRHTVLEDDVQAVVDVLNSDYLTCGPAVEKFEQTLTNYTGAKYAVAVSNGTAGLHVAMLAAGIEKGSIGCTSAVTFAASANAMLYCDIKPVFTDVEPNTGLMCMKSLAEKLEQQKQMGEPIRVVIPVHLTGQPVNTSALMDLKKKYSFTVVEDACHALGATYGTANVRVGNLEGSEMSVLSFHPVKHVATGEGGAILTNDKKIYERLTKFRTHGIVKDPSLFEIQSDAHDKNGKVNPWYMEMIDLGYNYRLPDILAALGTSQMKRIDEIVSKRRDLAARYQKRLEGNPFFDVIKPDAYGLSSYHLQVVKMKSPSLCERRGDLMRALSEKSVGTQVHYIPVTAHPFYRKLGYKTPKGAAEYYSQILSLPMYPAMTFEDVDYVIEQMTITAQNILECT